MKTILITGANGGIGKAVNEALTADKHAVNGLTRADADLSDPAAIASLAQRVKKDAPVLDWIIFSHGWIDAETDIEKQAVENVRRTFDTNTLSIVYLSQQLLSSLSSDGGIIAISSTAGVNANGRYAAYSASKAAVNSFMQALARNRPEKKFFAVCPGPTDTAMWGKIGGEIGRAQDPQEVAGLVRSIINGDAEYRSGDIVVVRDGITSIVSRIS